MFTKFSKNFLEINIQAVDALSFITFQVSVCVMIEGKPIKGDHEIFVDTEFMWLVKMSNFTLDQLTVAKSGVCQIHSLIFICKK